MTRPVTLAAWVLIAASFAPPVRADDPPKSLTPGDRKELEEKLDDLNGAGMKAYRAGQYTEAVKAFRSAVEVAGRLYPKAEFPDGHPDVASNLNNLAALYQAQGKLADAEPLYRDALAMRRRLFKGDHPDVATSLNNLAYLHRAQGRLADAEALYRDALAMRRRLFKGDHPDVATSLNNLAFLSQAQGKLIDAEPLYRDALDMAKRLFKGDHRNVALGLCNLAALYQAQGRLADAEPLSKDALDMFRRLSKGDHPDVAVTLNNLAALYRTQGKLADAEPLYRDALDMSRRLFKGDHPDVALGLCNLADLYQAQGKLADAEPLFKDALAMRRRLFKGDHPEVAQSLNNLAYLYDGQGKLADAEPLYRDALGMWRRLFKGDHPDVALSLSNLADLCEAQGKHADAEPLYRDALTMRRRLFKGDHPDVVRSLNNLADLHRAQGNMADAESRFRDALDMSRRITNSYAKTKSEGEALTYAAAQPLVRDGLLSVVRLRSVGSPGYDSGAAYAAVWAAKGTVARVFEQRQQQARVATGHPELAGAVANLGVARRRRAELLLAPATSDPGTRSRREADLKALDATIAGLTKTLSGLPAVARTERLNAATLAELQKALPADATLVDYVRYASFEWDDARPAGQKERRTERYAAFVATRDAVRWVDLDAAKAIDAAVGLWREAITTPPHAVPADVPARVRDLVWGPVRKHLPPSTKVVYVCPDAELTRVPWAALPGDRPGTILLEDFAVATVPHAPFLLDSLWPADTRGDAPAGLLAVGGVAFTGEVPPSPGAPKAVATRGDPLVAPKKPLHWPDLPGAKVEAEQVARGAAGHKLDARTLTGTAATADAVLAALPKARYAHLATHGFFADAQFRSVLQVDPKDYARSRRGERIGRVANSPMVLSGLVLAGANAPGTPGRGIVTGEALVDRDLSGLELAVLSACETGLGEVAGGEGVFGLQRAFHVAGARNVVASLWKVPDAATAALMGEFYRALWDEKLPPVLALQKAQLAVYRADPKEFKALALRGVGPGDANFDAAAQAVGKTPVNAAGKNPAVLWAAFSLSGAGR